MSAGHGGGGSASSAYTCPECRIVLESAEGLARHVKLFCTATGAWEVGKSLPGSVRSSVQMPHSAGGTGARGDSPLGRPNDVPPLGATSGAPPPLVHHDTAALLREVVRRRAGEDMVRALEGDIDALVAGGGGGGGSGASAFPTSLSPGPLTPPETLSHDLPPARWRDMDPKEMLADWQRLQADGSVGAHEQFTALEERIHALRGVADTAVWASQRPGQGQLPAAVEYGAAGRPALHGRRAVLAGRVRESRDDLGLNAYVPSHPSHGVGGAVQPRRVVSAQGTHPPQPEGGASLPPLQRAAHLQASHPHAHAHAHAPPEAQAQSPPAPVSPHTQQHTQVVPPPPHMGGPSPHPHPHAQQHPRVLHTVLPGGGQGVVASAAGLPHHHHHHHYHHQGPHTYPHGPGPLSPVPMPMAAGFAGVGNGIGMANGSVPGAPLAALQNLKHALEVRGEQKLLDDIDALAVEVAVMQGGAAGGAPSTGPYGAGGGGGGMAGFPSGVSPVLQVQLQGLMRRMNEQMATTAALMADGNSGPLQAEVESLKQQLQATREAMKMSRVRDEATPAAQSMKDALEDMRARREIARMRFEMQKEEEEFEREMRRRREDEEQQREQKRLFEEQQQREEALRLDKLRQSTQASPAGSAGNGGEATQQAARAAHAHANASQGVLVFFDRVTGLPKFGPHVKAWPGREIRVVFAAYEGSRQITPLRALLPTSVEQDPAAPNHRICFTAQQKRIAQLDPSTPDQHLIVEVQLVVKKPLAPGDVIETVPYAWSVVPLTSGEGSLCTGPVRVPLFFEPVEPAVVPAEMDTRFLRLEDKEYNTFHVRHQLCVRVVVPARAAAEMSKAVWDRTVETYVVPAIYERKEAELWGAKAEPPEAADAPPRTSPLLDDKPPVPPVRKASVNFLNVAGASTMAGSSSRQAPATGSPLQPPITRRRSGRLGGRFMQDNITRRAGEAPLQWLDVQPLRAVLPNAVARAQILLTVHVCIPQTQALLRRYPAHFERLAGLPMVGGCSKVFSWSPGCVPRRIVDGDIAVDWGGMPSATASQFTHDPAGGGTPPHVPVLADTLVLSDYPAHRFPVPPPFVPADVVVIVEFAAGEVMDLTEQFVMWGSDTVGAMTRTRGAWSEMKFELKQPPVQFERGGSASGGLARDDSARALRRRSFKSFRDPATAVTSARVYQHDFKCMVRVVGEPAASPAAVAAAAAAAAPNRDPSENISVVRMESGRLSSRGSSVAQAVETTWTRPTEATTADDAAASPMKSLPRVDSKATYRQSFVFPVDTPRREGAPPQAAEPPQAPHRSNVPYQHWIRSSRPISPVPAEPKVAVHLSIVGARFLPANVLASRVVGRVYAAPRDAPPGAGTGTLLGKPFAVYQNVGSDVQFPTYSGLIAQAAHHVVKDVAGRSDVFCSVAIEAIDAVTGRPAVVGYAEVPLVVNGSVVTGGIQLRMHAGPLPPRPMGWGLLDSCPRLPLASVLAMVTCSETEQLDTSTYGAEHEYARGKFNTLACEPVAAEHVVYAAFDYDAKEVRTTLAARLKGTGATDPAQFSPRTRRRPGPLGASNQVNSMLCTFEDAQMQFLRTKFEVLLGPVDRMPLPLLTAGCASPYAPGRGVCLRVESLTGLQGTSLKAVHKVAGRVYVVRANGVLEGVQTFFTERTVWGGDVSQVWFNDSDVVATASGDARRRPPLSPRSHVGSAGSADRETPTAADPAAGNEVQRAFAVLQLVRCADLQDAVPKATSVGWYALDLLTSYSFAPAALYVRHGTYTIPFITGEAGPPEGFLSALQSMAPMEEALAALKGKAAAPVKWHAARISVTDGLRRGEFRGKHAQPQKLLEPKHASRYNQVPVQDVRLADALYKNYKTMLAAFETLNDATPTAAAARYEEEVLNPAVADAYGARVRYRPRTRTRVGDIENGGEGEGGDADGDDRRPLLPTTTPHHEDDVYISKQQSGWTVGSDGRYDGRTLRVAKIDGKVGVKFVGREVTWVKPGGAAFNAGVREGMLLLAVDGHELQGDARTADILPLFTGAPDVFDVVVVDPAEEEDDDDYYSDPDAVEQAITLTKIAGRAGLKFVGREVTAVVPEGAAERAGIQVGMTMVSVNGQLLEVDATSGEVTEAIKAAPEKFVIVVTS